jgi:hypothetical protein
MVYGTSKQSGSVMISCNFLPVKSFVFRDITLWNLLKVNQWFGGTCQLHPQGWILSRSRNGYACCLLHVGFLLGILLSSEDEGDMFLQKVCQLSIHWGGGGLCGLSPRANYTFADRECHMVSVMDPYGRILGFLDRSCYFFFQVALQLHSQGWVDPIPDPLHLRKSGSAGNRTWTSGSVARNSDH